MDKMREIDPATQAEFDDFAARWEAINKEGEDRRWLHWTGYESGPVLHTPYEIEYERHRDEQARIYASERLKETRAAAKRDAQYAAAQAKLQRQIYGYSR